jgi:hypothetical protein
MNYTLVSGDWISGRKGVNGLTRSRNRSPDMIANFRGGSGKERERSAIVVFKIISPRDSCSIEVTKQGGGVSA